MGKENWQIFAVRGRAFRSFRLFRSTRHQITESQGFDRQYLTGPFASGGGTTGTRILTRPVYFPGALLHPGSAIRLCASLKLPASEYGIFSTA